MTIKGIQKEWTQLWDRLIAAQKFDKEPSSDKYTFINTMEIGEWFPKRVECQEFDVKKFSAFEYRGKPCVPGCCYCGKIRDIDGMWHNIELPEGIEISDSYCPECLAEHYAELTT